MKNEISNADIENIIEMVKTSLGIKEPIHTDNLFSLLNIGKTKEAIKMIAQQLGLPIDIIITMVTDDYIHKNNQNRFESMSLVNVDENGYGNEGIIAQVTIPDNLPIYSSIALNNFPINIKLSNTNIQNPVTFTMIMAHEISHILLHSLRHSQKENEFFTDITAMMLGFQDVFNNGRKSKNGKITYGYLNDKQFNFAFEKITSILEKNRKNDKEFLFKLKNYEKLLKKYEKKLFKFKNYLEILTKSNTKKISGKDGKIISSFFQSGYIEIFDEQLSIQKKTFNFAQNLTITNLHYTEYNAKQKIKYSNEIIKQSLKIKDSLFFLKKNIKVIEKYISYKNRTNYEYLLKLPQMLKSKISHSTSR